MKKLLKKLFPKLWEKKSKLWVNLASHSSELTLDEVQQLVDNICEIIKTENVKNIAKCADILNIDLY